MSAHLDTDALADVLAGLGHPEHLDGCADCQGALTELSTAMASVTVALAQLPDPAVPDGLAARIEAALVAAGAPAPPLAAPAGDPVVAPLASSTITPLDVKRSGVPVWAKATGALATAAALVVGTVLVLNSGSSPAKRLSAGSAPDIARNATGRDYTKDPASLTDALPQLLKGNAPSAPPEAFANKVEAPSVASPGPTTDSSATTTLAQGTVDALAPLKGKDGLAACLSSLSDPSDPGIPLALDYGSYDGQPALLVLLPAAKKGFVLAFFVSPECNATDSHLLFYEKVPSP